MVINGKKYDFKDQKLTDLLNLLKIDSRHVVVELNGKIIETKNFENLVVNYQDKLEIITFVGGG
jgi:sulfur carrier protein